MNEEPQIIHYYSELPNYAIIINNLNEEYEDLITNYIKLEDRIEPIKATDKNNFCLFLSFIIVFEFSIICILI